MINTDWIALFQLIPHERHSKLVLVLNTGSEVNVEAFVRFESTHLVLRGRVAGSTDEGRAFFVPYTYLLYLRIDENVKVSEINDFYHLIDATRQAEEEAKKAASNAKPGTLSGGQNLNRTGSSASSLLERIARTGKKE